MIDVYEYYERVWGPPSREAEFTISGIPIEIYKWDEKATDMGATLYATNGASARPASYTHRTEFFTGFTSEIDSIADSLALLAHYAVAVGPIERGETVTFPDPLWEGSRMNTYFAIPPLETILAPLRIDEGLHIEFLHVVPIYPCELDLKKAHGAEWLLGEINDAGLSASDPFRVSCCA
ncbi:hypothetical protein Rhe02_07690 [Rhizocola hellebori]|uniref:Suppressor of fused-like domain-containing protein n=1 Tax=Rhizocola hellebori TaxID=1392758 RepID=A0A8J3Q3B4_9ACTN|nr:suppressor of fused domain protein [Rhizocola hellebori]GIH02702.1 hypothetical protein Rhe02_07690 [Rhizocola hellebori]